MSVIEARYGRALRSTQLRMEEAPGDIDTLAAAGMADTLGARLLRLRNEYDSVRKAQAHAQANLVRTLAEAEHAKHAAKNAEKTGLADIARLREKPAVVENVVEQLAAKRIKALAESERIQNDAHRQALTNHLLILIELGSLEPAKQMLGQFAWQISERRSFGLAVADVERIVGAVLDAWLDRVCHSCDGRGFTGGYDGPQIPCRGPDSCRETGNRRQGLFSNRIAGQALAEKLLFEMDRSVEAAMRRMNRLLRTD